MVGLLGDEPVFFSLFFSSFFSSFFFFGAYNGSGKGGKEVEGRVGVLMFRTVCVYPNNMYLLYLLYLLYSRS